MDKYIYLILAIAFLIPVTVIYFIRIDLRQMIKILFFIGGPMGLIAEYWHFQDYWRPPTLSGLAKVSIEDYLFGASVVCLGAVIYKFVYKMKYLNNAYPKRYKFLLVYIVLGYACMIIFNSWLHINSIFVSSILFLIITICMIMLRSDLLVQSLMSGVLLTVFALLVYVILFNLLSPHYWDKYWLLSNTKYGTTLFGNIPLTELFWYFSWGCLAGIVYDFTTGSGLRKQGISGMER